MKHGLTVLGLVNKCSNHYAYRNFEGNNLKHYLMLKYNNAEPS